MPEFTLLRPLWLLALPLLAWLTWRLWRAPMRGGAWARWIAPSLHAHVLSGRDDHRGTGRFAGLVGLAGLLAIVALAGPAWERVPQPLYQADSALVIVLDLSRSMDAQDIAPSRLARAVLKVRDILERRPADQFGLVVYSANAFVVTPLTTDARNIELLLPELSTSIMPSQGSFPAVGLRKGAELLDQAGLPGGDLLLVADEAGGPGARRVAAELAARDIRTSVLAVGTPAGAPVPVGDGRLLRDRDGRVVVPGMSEGPLRQLAAEGRGRFAVLSADDRDLDHLLSPLLRRSAGEARAADAQADAWRDRGPWLLLALLPLGLLGFRRGALVPVVPLLPLLLLVMPVVPAEAEAGQWRAALTNADRQALQILEQGDAQRAAALFADPHWRAAALYRAGRYAESAAALADLDDVQAQYNRGTALAQAGDLQGALVALEQALAQDPEHADARHNHAVISELLARSQAEADPMAQGTPSPGEGDGQREDASQAGPPESGQADPSQAQDAGEGQPEADGRDGQRDARAAAADSADEADGAEAALAAQRSETIDFPDEEEVRQAMEQWLRQVPDEPGVLLQRKFEYQYRRQQRDQDGNPTWPGDELQPW
ncbi:MAG: VWA domain-containing protein [Gammaproteobacteria bacterium]|nr:VWA domain-containing protein [Gammaproteobacteria bacterium]